MHLFCYRQLWQRVTVFFVRVYKLTYLLTYLLFTINILVSYTTVTFICLHVKRLSHFSVCINVTCSDYKHDM